MTDERSRARQTRTSSVPVPTWPAICAALRAISSRSQNRGRTLRFSQRTGGLEWGSVYSHDECGAERHQLWCHQPPVARTNASPQTPAGFADHPRSYNPMMDPSVRSSGMRWVAGEAPRGNHGSRLDRTRVVLKSTNAARGFARPC